MTTPTDKPVDGEESAAPLERPVRPPWLEFKAALEAAGFHPSRKLGQNFLLDDNMARAIAADAGIEPGRFVLEIGPGCGFLSVHLASFGARLLAVEIDTRLAPIARRFLGPFQSAEVIEHDVLAAKSRLAPEVLERLPDSEPWSLCSNLPYSISGPLLAIVSQLEHPPEVICCLVQKEVAERLAAGPGSGIWGPLSASFQESYSVSMGRLVPPQLFWPRPKVDSAVFIARLRPDLAPADVRRKRIAFFRELLQRRRQSIRRVLGDMVGRDIADGALLSVEMDPKARAETLTVEQLRALHREVEAPSSDPA